MVFFLFKTYREQSYRIWPLQPLRSQQNLQIVWLKELKQNTFKGRTLTPNPFTLLSSGTFLSKQNMGKSKLRKDMAFLTCSSIAF